MRHTSLAALTLSWPPYTTMCAQPLPSSHTTALWS